MEEDTMLLNAQLHKNDITFLLFSNILLIYNIYAILQQAAIKETREKLASSFGEVSWRGKTIPIRNEKARVFILRIQDKASELERQETFEKKMEVFDNLLMESKDAIQVIKDEISSEMVCISIMLC